MVCGLTEADPSRQLLSLSLSKGLPVPRGCDARWRRFRGAVQVRVAARAWLWPVGNWRGSLGGLTRGGRGSQLVQPAVLGSESLGSLEAERWSTMTEGPAGGTG